MALQGSGQISFSDIINEFGSPSPAALGSYRVSQERNRKNIEDVKELGGVVQAFVVASRHVITIDHRSKVYPRVVIY